MDGKRVTIVAIVAILVGLLIGYLFWGHQLKTTQGELDQLKARLAEAQAAAGREKDLTAKLQELETQLKQVTDDLAKEKQRRETMQGQMAKGKK
jgi:Tfp pilus assembly protein PilO